MITMLTTCTLCHFYPCVNIVCLIEKLSRSTAMDRTTASAM